MSCEAEKHLRQSTVFVLQCNLNIFLLTLSKTKPWIVYRTDNGAIFFFFFQLEMEEQT